MGWDLYPLHYVEAQEKSAWILNLMRQEYHHIMSKGTLELKDYCEFSLLLALLLSGQSLLEHKKQLGEWVQSDETIDQGVIFFFF